MSAVVPELKVVGTDFDAIRWMMFVLLLPRSVGVESDVCRVWFEVRKIDMIFPNFASERR